MCCATVATMAPQVWFGHATWDSYSNMAPRIYKTYRQQPRRVALSLLNAFPPVHARRLARLGVG